MTAFFGFCPPCPPPPENLKHIHFGRVFWARVGSVIFPPPYHSCRTQKTQSNWLGFELFLPFPPPHPKTQNTSITDVFSGFGWVRLPSPIHIAPPQPKKPGQKWPGFVLLPHPLPISPSTRNLKTRPLRTCFLASGDFVYLPQCLLHVQNTKNPV